MGDSRDWPLSPWAREQRRHELAGGLTVDEVEAQWAERVRRMREARNGRRDLWAFTDDRNSASPNEPQERSW